MSTYGIGLSWTITNSAQQVEVWRSADDGAGSPSTGTETLIATLEAGSTGFIDFLPNNNTLYHYRVRHSNPNYTPGGFSAYVRAKPRTIPRFGQPQQATL